MDMSMIRKSSKLIKHCSMQEQRWLFSQDDLLTWQMRAETAEARLSPSPLNGSK